LLWRKEGTEEKEQKGGLNRDRQINCMRYMSYDKWPDRSVCIK